MALDLNKIGNQITGMVGSLKAHRDEKRQQLQHAVAILHSQSNNLEKLSQKIEASKVTWLVARLVEPIRPSLSASFLPRKNSPSSLPTVRTSTWTGTSRRIAI